MNSFSPELARIRVQTARMMEIYALLQSELEKNRHLSLSETARVQLNRAIATIEANMRQLQAHIVSCGEETSSSEDARALEEILEAVLKWQMERENGG